MDLLDRWQVRHFQPPPLEHHFPVPARFVGGLPSVLDLEIGCGVGWHPIRYALENPERTLIALEHTRAKFARFQRRLYAHSPIENLVAVHADAVSWVSEILPSWSIDRCFLFYPNPEPKAPNKRWLRSPFMHELLAKLKPGGELHLATNEEWYRQEAREWALYSWHLELISENELRRSDGIAYSPRTHFEKKYLERGQTCFDVVWRKPSRSNV